MLEVPIDCTPVAASHGSTCAVNTTADSLIPNYARESRRAVISVLGISVDDPGPNGTGYGVGCPSTCGDGDESTYMRQGLVEP